MNNPEIEQHDEVFIAEQEHLTQTHETLTQIGQALMAEMKKIDEDAAEDKRTMVDDITHNHASADEAQEMAVDLANVNAIIDAYNLMQDANAQKLVNIQRLLHQPYFAKIELEYKPGAPVKELYIGNAGISDDNYRRLVVDWRSPVAEVYYNQDFGCTSYEAQGRTISVDLKLRRQFDIVGDKLNAYFDTTIAIQDSLLLASLSKQRSAQMQAITTTIQKEQNSVIRHEDVPVLIVNGIAGSGKTSVLMQRIAYLFYRNREDIRPEEVVLITPNAVFRHYIENVLPDLGEENPALVTFDEFAANLLPAGRGVTKQDTTLSDLHAIDQAIERLAFNPNDYRNIECEGITFIKAEHIQGIAARYKHIQPGSHLCSLIREELLTRVESRFKQMSHRESVHNEMAELSIQEQVDLFGETYDPQSDEQAARFALIYLKDRYGEVYHQVETDAWLRIDRIGMRILRIPGLTNLQWLYLKMVATGLSDPSIKYVMIDEAQDYSAAQMYVMARYFRRARFMLLGDKNQAISGKSMTRSELEQVFASRCDQLAECSLTTSYRSTPEITQLFASLLPADEQVSISSVQRNGVAPEIIECHDEEEYRKTLLDRINQAKQVDGTAALLALDLRQAKWLERLLGEEVPHLMSNKDLLPDTGLSFLTLKTAKGLEFDEVIIADAQQMHFSEGAVSRNRLYTMISRATRKVTILSNGPLADLLQQ